MKKDIERILEVPEGVNVSFEGESVKVSGNGKELERNFGFRKIKMEMKEGKVFITSKNATKNESKLAGTAEGHIKNMMQGIGEDFVYKLEIANVHFPMTVKIEGNIITIKNFLGEKVDRVSKILPDVKVDIKGMNVEVSSFNKESAGQTAANLESATKVKGRDRRVFQDGIFITEKAGRAI